MHDDNNVWMKQIKKLKKESIFAKLKEFFFFFYNLSTLKFKEEKKSNLVTCYHEIETQHY
jgi:hypothetical protein